MGETLPPELRLPEHPRHLRLYRMQWLGLAILFCIPVVALLGFFGDATRHETVEQGVLALSAEYPTRTRYSTRAKVRIAVENRSGADLDSVRISLAPEYLAGFTVESFTPDPDKSFEWMLPPLAPGETAHVWAVLEAERYGRHRGDLQVHMQRGAMGPELSLSTFIFP